MIIQPGDIEKVVAAVKTPVVTNPKAVAATGNSAVAGDQIAISGKAKESYQAREKVRKNTEIREALVAQMKKKLERDPYPAGPVADILADKIINGWGCIGIS